MLILHVREMVPFEDVPGEGGEIAWTMTGTGEAPHK